ncbi:MAG TPA: MFS transporter [Thermoanaerobaculia bacterium]|nr:MFS transporter [Thermoanaerobaculia bacterium]HQR67132.1 MFS transporter [Thermoanaerobaculia bacterium]
MSRERAAPTAGTVVAWSLYELGATAFAMNLLSLHFPLDVATRAARGNEKFSVTFGLSMAVVAVAAPVLGLLADRWGKRRFLVPFVLGGVAGTALVAAPAPLAVTLLVFALANVAFQSAYVFYNAMLPDVARPGEQGRVSGWGVAAGYAGSLLAMFVALPFVSGEIRARLPGALQAVCAALSVSPVSSSAEAPWVRANAYLPTALLWLLAAVPLLFFARLPRDGRGAAASPSSLSKDPRSVLSSFREVLRTIRSLPATPSILWYLVSSFLYFDVIHTVQIQMATYSRFAVGMSDGEVQVFLLLCTAVAVLGGLLYGALCQRVAIRTATLVALANWVVVFVLALVVRDHRLFLGVGLLAGVGLGGVKVTSRLALIELVPKERLTEFFGFFTLAGEAASVLGPLLWAAVLALFPDRSPTGYRVGLLVLLLVLLGAVAALRKVSFPAPR